MIKQISVFVENKKGKLVNVISLLGKNDVNIRAMSVADTTDYGILRLIVDVPDQALKALQDEGMAARATDVIAAKMSDAPGGLAAVLEVLKDADIGVEYMYAFLGRIGQEAIVIFKLDDNEKGEALLKEKTFGIMEDEQVYKL